MKRTVLSKKIKERLQTPVPQHLIKRQPYDKNISYVTGNYIINYLNYVFDYDWDILECEQWLQQGEDFIVKDKKTKEIKERIPQPAIAHVKLKVRFNYTDDEGVYRSIYKTTYGAKTVEGVASKQEDIYKSACTDAIKKAASMIGIANDLYLDDKELAYLEDLAYENPWTDALYKEHQAAWDYINQLTNEIENGKEFLNQYIYYFSNELANDIRFITPDNIEDFVSYIVKYNEQN